MFQHSKRVYIGGEDVQILRYLSATDNYVNLKELGGQSSLLLNDGLDQQHQLNTFQSDDQLLPLAAAEAIPQQGSEQYQVNQHQNSTGVVTLSEKGRDRRRKGAPLSEEEKRKRKRENDAKYRKNKILENKRLKDEINKLRNTLQASKQRRETEALLSIHELVQDLDVMRTDFAVALDNESLRNFGENQTPITHPDQNVFHGDDPSFLMQNDDQSQPLVENEPITYVQDDNQRALPAVLRDGDSHQTALFAGVQNDAAQSLEEHQSLTHQPQNDIQRAFPVVLQDQSQRTLLAVGQNDTLTTQDENQLLTQPPPRELPACYLAFMEKLERDERSTVSYADFEALLQAETREVGGYRIPLTLLHTYKKIMTAYGNITSSCLFCSFSAENVLLLLLATIKEMDDTSIEQVTEDLIFKWRDCIAEAKRIKFNVEFVAIHLKQIARSYLGRKILNELSGLNTTMETLKKELNDLERKKLEHEIYLPQLQADSEHFHGHVGLF